MLISRHIYKVSRQAQSGVVLLVALIVLVAMTLAGVALVRSMDTSGLIAGNMAFQQAATHSADEGVEAAISWLEANNSGATLDSAIPSSGYTASAASNASYVTAGPALWDSLPTATCLLPLTAGVCSASPGTPDASGNIISYKIQRLCNASGNRNGAGCAITPGTSNTNGSCDCPDDPKLEISTAVYYRITVRVAGPRNTEIYTQTIVAM
ncbi:MAG: hypothetical protein ABL903_19380 [Methylococcales bacterium]